MLASGTLLRSAGHPLELAERALAACLCEQMSYAAPFLDLLWTRKPFLVHTLLLHQLNLAAGHRLLKLPHIQYRACAAFEACPLHNAAPCLTIYVLCCRGCGVLYHSMCYRSCRNGTACMSEMPACHFVCFSHAPATSSRAPTGAPIPPGCDFFPSFHFHLCSLWFVRGRCTPV